MKLVILTSFLLTSMGVFASPETICGVDERVPTRDLRIGRIKLPGVDAACTATMIGPDCAITAGHCFKHLKDVQFDVPQSFKGIPQNADARDTYQINPASIVYVDKGSEDWAVFKLKANPITKLLPGKAYGFYKVNFSMPTPGEDISIAGYGSDDKLGGILNYTLQTHHGALVSVQSNISGRVLSYRIDTTGGNSGSAIIRTRQQDIIGVHTHGGCSSTENTGTTLAQRLDFQKAIKSCLEYHSR